MIAEVTLSVFSLLGCKNGQLSFTQNLLITIQMTKFSINFWFILLK